MHHAAIHNHSEIINFLINHGAEINIMIGDFEASPLHLAVKHNSCMAVKVLIENDAMLEITDHHGRIPLYYACESGSNQAIETILREAEAKKAIHTIIDNCDKSRLTPLHIAVATCSLHAIRLLLQYGSDILKKDLAGNTALLKATKRKRTQIMKLLLDHATFQGKKDYVCFPNDNRFTALHLAVDSGSLENTELCLKFGANIESQSTGLLTPLHLAALNGCYDIAKILIVNGAIVNAPDLKLKTCLHYASISNNTKLIELLLNHGASIESKDKKLQIPIMVAASHNNVDTLRFLLQNDANVFTQDQDGKTCLHLIAERDCIDAFNIFGKQYGRDLIQIHDYAGFTSTLAAAAAAGSNSILTEIAAQFGDTIINHQDNHGNNALHLAAIHHHRDTVRTIIDQMPFMNRPLHLAAKNGSSRVIHYLIKHGADVNCRDHSGWYLHFAIKYGHLMSVKLLLFEGSEINVFNETEETPLLMACEMRHIEIAVLLLEKGANPAIRNNKDQNCLDIACEHRLNDIGLAIIKTKFWEKVMENRAYDGYHPMKRLLHRMPVVAEAVMDRSITFVKTKNGNDVVKQVSFDFTYLESSPEDHHLQDVKDKYIAVETICSLSQTKLMKHPLINAYSYSKWKLAVNFTIYFKIISDIFYFIGLGVPIALNTADYLGTAAANRSLGVTDGNNNYATLVIQGAPIRNIVVLATVILMLCSTVISLLFGRRLVSYFFKQTVFEIIIELLGLMYALPIHKTISYTSIRIGAMLVLCLVINVIFTFRNLYGIGLYISMFITIIITICKTSVVIILFVLAFAISFSMILSDMIGLAVGDIKEIREKAHLNQIKGNFQMVIGAYESFPLFIKKYMYKPGLIFQIGEKPSFLNTQIWNFLTENIKIINGEENVNEETELKELKVLFLDQKAEILRLKELVEDTKSDVNFHSKVNRNHTKKLIDEVLDSIHTQDL